MRRHRLDFQQLPCVLFWATKLFGLHRGSFTPMFQNFYLRGLTNPFLLRPTHINYILIYALNRESFIRRRPKYELTTHSPTLMMDDHTHAHTPNMLMSLCICNANMTHSITCLISNYQAMTHKQCISFNMSFHTQVISTLSATINFSENL